MNPLHPNHSNSRNPSLNRNAGFTLVELLTVIAIILFLVGLLMPTLGRVRETAKMTKCVSNLRQIYIATFAYAADNDGKAPYDLKLVIKKGASHEGYFVSRSHDVNDSTYKTYYPSNKWFAEYLGGMGSGQMGEVGYCPKGGRMGELGANPSSGGKWYPNFSYGINPDLVHYDWFVENEHDDRADTPLNQTPYPSTVSLWMDGVRSTVYEKGASLSGRHFSTTKVPNGDIVGAESVYQGLGKANVVFVDGHIGQVLFPEETPAWNCHFWRVYNVDNCRKEPCSWCDSGKCGRCDK